MYVAIWSKYFKGIFRHIADQLTKFVNENEEQAWS